MHYRKHSHLPFILNIKESQKYLFIIIIIIQFKHFKRKRNIYLHKLYEIRRKKKHSWFFLKVILFNRSLSVCVRPPIKGFFFNTRINNSFLYMHSAYLIFLCLIIQKKTCSVLKIKLLVYSIQVLDLSFLIKHHHLNFLLNIIEGNIINLRTD